MCRGGCSARSSGPLLTGFLAAGPWSFVLSAVTPICGRCRALAALVIAAIAAGTAPALVGGDPAADGMKMASRGTAALPASAAGHRADRSEIALTLVLLVSGTLLLRSYDKLATLDLGYRATASRAWR